MRPYRRRSEARRGARSPMHLPTASPTWPGSSRHRPTRRCSRRERYRRSSASTSRARTSHWSRAPAAAACASLSTARICSNFAIRSRPTRAPARPERPPAPPLPSPTSGLDLKPDWSLAAQTQNAAAKLDGRCTIGSTATVDLTPQIGAAYAKIVDDASNALAGVVRGVTSRVVRREIESAWTQLGMPYQVQPGVWFVLNPDNYQFAQPSFAVTGPDLHMTANFVLVARPQVALGTKPSSCRSRSRRCSRSAPRKASTSRSTR